MIKNGATAGAVLCTLNLDGNINKGKCIFKDIKNGIMDEFFIYVDVPKDCFKQNENKTDLR